MTTRDLTKGQGVVLGAAAVIMAAVGGFGAWGTYTNVMAQFHRGATAAGVVAAGEGLALVLALTMLGLTMLGQSSPTVVRVGLWLAPMGACLTGLSIATTTAEAVVYAVTPLAMSGAAEGLGLIARRIVVYRTGVDAEAQEALSAAPKWQRAESVKREIEAVRGKLSTLRHRAEKEPALVAVGDSWLGGWTPAVLPPLPHRWRAPSRTACAA